MEPIARKILVVGGNGFVGSAVCRAALARGYQVNWQKANALDPSTYAHLLPETSAVVHTLGTLLEDARYKAALKDGDVFKLVGTFASSFFGSEGSNPLRDEEREGGYALLNRDAALRVCEAFVASTPSSSVHPRPFVYVSAEDIFRPFISPRYIESKREAERGIDHLTAGNPNYRAVYVRPSLIYHPHFRPLTSPVAALLDLSATVHANAPAQLPTPSKVLRALSSSSSKGAQETLVHPSALHSVANALVIPPIHVDHVAEAICVAADETREDVRGVVDVKEMRRLDDEVTTVLVHAYGGSAGCHSKVKLLITNQTPFIIVAVNQYSTASSSMVEVGFLRLLSRSTSTVLVLRRVLQELRLVEAQRSTSPEQKLQLRSLPNLHAISDIAAGRTPATGDGIPTKITLPKS